MEPIRQSLVDLLREPLTNLRLDQIEVGPAEAALGSAVQPLRTNGHAHAKPIGRTEWVLKVRGENRYYPIVGQIPVLLRPEVLGPASDTTTFDLRAPAYEEAYLEMEFYNQFASAEAEELKKSSDFAELSDFVRGDAEVGVGEPSLDWLDAVHDMRSQADAYQALAPFSGERTFMQIGGKGLHALKLLVGGAQTSVLLTPMIGEARFGLILAEEFSLGERFGAVVGVAEELPFADSVFDGSYAGGCAHHFTMDLAMPEVRRTLKIGAAFAAVEPYRAPLYSIGTKLFGKRESNAHCSPMDESRIAPMHAAFRDSEVRHHGTFLRYPLLALEKAGVTPARSIMARVAELDDRVAEMLRVSKHGSSVSLIARRSDGD